MSISIGIVGLANVGKSTLFKALTRNPVDISNYPFCTIEPNIGIVKVPDERLLKLTKFTTSGRSIPAVIKFVDIAGLVKNAHKGEGLGNQFLAHIKQVDAILYVLRGFENKKVPSSEEGINPKRDLEIIVSELILKDIETIEKRLESLKKEIKKGEKKAMEEMAIIKEVQESLNKEEMVIKYLKRFSEKERERRIEFLKPLCLLTAKKGIILLNTNDSKTDEQLKRKAEEMDFPYIVLDAKEACEISELTKKEKKELGIKENPLDSLIRTSYKILDLITFFTIKEDRTEVRAWSIKRGTKAPKAAGIIHSDFEKKFIKVEVINWKKLLNFESWAQAKGAGAISTEGKDYEIEDGDVILVKHG